MNGFKEQVAVITGAASGIGCAISHFLLKQGAHVALLDINEEALRREFKNYNSLARIYPIDITNESLIIEIIDEIVGLFTKIDILVNCAGITGQTNLLSHEVCTKDLRKVFDVNFMSSFYTTKAVLPHMIKTNYGR